MSDTIDAEDLINATIVGVTVRVLSCERIVIGLCIELDDDREIEIHAARGGELVIRREQS